mmetsp:Transcript_26718/g.48132  ORF Transcript_26718/g.48132 Transcript_26718/m.48132 type:complete len:494 (+) Transcript_26718:895-2376(+)
MEAIMQIALARWLRAHEVFRLLRFPGDLSIVTEYSEKPKHGDLYIIQKTRFSRWKQDGHSYRLRKSGTGVREDREKYNDGTDTVICTYVHSADSPSFHRRAYWLQSSPDTVLVHYLDDRLVECGSGDKIPEEPQGSTQISSQTSDMLEDYDVLEDLSRVEIVDYSPDWDDVSGGAKVLLCVSPAVLVPDLRLLFVAFGDTRVNLEHVQLGVMRCRAPPHMPGFVDLYLIYDGQELSLERKSFQYKQSSKKRAEPTTISWRSLNDHEFKVRLVEHMTSFDTTVDWEQSDPDDTNIDDLIAQFVIQMQHRGRDTNRFDDYGFTIIHYCAALGMTKALKLFDDEDYSIKTAEGLTPLEIAKMRDQSAAVAVLLTHEGELPKSSSKCGSDDEALGKSASTRTKKLSEQDIEKQVKVIQSNVKSWLIRRHFNDVQRATNTLRRAVRTLLLRKQFLDQKKAAKLIQKTYREWLNNKESLKSSVRKWPSFKRISKDLQDL